MKQLTVEGALSSRFADSLQQRRKEEANKPREKCTEKKGRSKQTEGEMHREERKKQTNRGRNAQRIKEEANKPREKCTEKKGRSEQTEGEMHKDVKLLENRTRVWRTRIRAGGEPAAMTVKYPSFAGFRDLTEQTDSKQRETVRSAAETSLHQNLV